ncbi:DAO-domain-containing protein [Gloeophyllum trabeum ATCC 11539]|uniref:DAO-domain-containing protein n=1 Tax=Gloeophyllum trabeum (strain ATCC 11539 / FP-39264 / Madison 617) TaxID=670483 RepID=S7QLL6_GLOTA|nr:DAO-domain-containing protein [Gloeophyllum trabeum ATCC 11539]EPQ60293.1 DAO-domain-containing protein [Gloeophyllum trabeum ATCC 11539]
MTGSTLEAGSHILVVGGGTWGLSTAWHLARRGYTNITCIDKFPYPSPDSAGYDLNKMARTEYAGEKFMQTVSREALNEWRSNPLFRTVFHETGRISVASSPSDYEGLREYYHELLQSPRARDVRWLDSPEEIHAFAPYLTGPLAQAKAVFNPEGGWVHARKSMELVGGECVHLGVRFITGPSGTAKELIFNGARTAVLGVRCEDGSTYLADRTVLAAGAWSDLLLDMENQLIAKCWTLAHIKLSEPERQALKGIPVILDEEKGFFFEPDEEGFVKICNEFPGFTNYQRVILDGKEKKLSVPRGHGSHPTDSMPSRSFQEVRELLDVLKPEWRDRDLLNAKICWCTDTPDRNFLISLHPRYGRSLVLATGDSGHGFKMLPTVGRYVADLVEGKEGSWNALEDGTEMRAKWRWRPDTADKRPGDDSRPGRGGDLSEEEGWKGNFKGTAQSQDDSDMLVYSYIPSTRAGPVISSLALAVILTSLVYFRPL